MLQTLDLVKELKAVLVWLQEEADEESQSVEPVITDL